MIVKASNAKLPAETAGSFIFAKECRRVPSQPADILLQYKKKDTPYGMSKRIESGDDLLSRAVASQVPSAC